MSFQSFSKLPPPPRNRTKSLPSPELMATLTLLCENTNNTYNVRTHVLAIIDFAAFANSLRDKFHRTPDSFLKQLRFAGFRRQREEEGEEEGEGGKPVRYVWRGRKDDCIAKELEFADRYMQAMVVKALEMRHKLAERKARLDQQFQRGIFWGINAKNPEVGRARLEEAVDEAKETINTAHHLSGEFARDIQATLQCEISLLRLLSFIQTEPEE